MNGQEENKMSKIGKIIIGIVLVANLAAVCYYVVDSYELRKEIRDVGRMKVDLPDDFKQAVATKALESTEQMAKNALDENMRRVQMTSKQLSESTKKMAKEILDENAKFMHDEMQESKVDVALNLAEKAKAAGNYDLAGKYAINAITHRGQESGIECFNKYKEIIVSATNEADDWKMMNYDLLESLILNAVVDGNAADVESLVAMIKEVRQAKDALVAQLPQEEELPVPEIKKEEAVHENMQNLLGMAEILRKKLNSSSEAEKNLCVSNIRECYQSVVSLYGTLLCEQSESVDADEVEVCRQLLEKSTQLAKNFEKELSTPYYVAVSNDVEKLNMYCAGILQGELGVADGRFTETITNTQQYVSELRKTAMNITDEDMAKSVTKLLSEVVGKIMEQLQKKRMESYQQFAINEIFAAAYVYDDFGTEVDDDSKDRRMRKAWSHLRLVSPGLLIPEVSEFYSSVWNKLFDTYADGQHGPEDGLDGRKDLKNLKKPTRWKMQRAKERGKQLEDF